MKDENDELKHRVSQMEIEHQSETRKTLELQAQVTNLEANLKQLHEKHEKETSPNIPDSLSQTKLMAELEEENLKLQKVDFRISVIYLF